MSAVIPFPTQGVLEQRYERKPGERAELHRKLDIVLDSRVEAFIKCTARIIRSSAHAARELEKLK